MKRYWAYLKYVLRHKYLVWKIGQRFDIPLTILLLHDISKFRPSEFIPYAKTFYTEDGISTYNPCRSFDEAWLHHQKRNKHHWQYWVSMGDSGVIEPIEIPMDHIYEMAVDMLTMSVSVKGSLSAYDYYQKIKDNIIMHNISKLSLEAILDSYRHFDIIFKNENK